MVIPCFEVAMNDAERESEALCISMLNKLISEVKKQTVEMEDLAVSMNEIAVGLKAITQPQEAPVHALPPSRTAPTATLVAAVGHAMAATTPCAEVSHAAESPTKCSTSGPDTNAGDIQVVAESEPEKGVPTVAPALTEHSSAPSPKLFSTIKQDTVTPTRCSTACRSCNTDVTITNHTPSIGADVDHAEAEATPCTDSIRATVMLANCSTPRRLYEQGGLKAWFRELPGGMLDSLPTEEVMQCPSEDDCAQLCTKLDDEMPRKWFDYYQGGVLWMPPWPPPQGHETLLKLSHKQVGIRSTMRLVKHPNVLQLFEVRASKSKIYFVLEYAKGGVLFNKIAKGGKLSEDAARWYFHQLISAVDYCHSRGVYHCDLKPENLLLDENENLKVSDFGLSALAESKRQDGLLHTTCGTPVYVAPEVLSRKGYDGAKADIWSCGVILFVLVAGYLPFHDTNLMETYRKISKADFRCPRYFSAELKELLHKILDSDPSTRISISRIKRSAWYRRPVEVNAKKNETETTDNTCSGEATTSGSTECSTSEGNQGSLSLPNLNAFDIISLSTGFNLSGFFEDKYGRREERFTTRQPVTTVLTKLKELGKRLKLKVKKKENGVLELAAPKEGKKGFLELDAEIFEVAPSFLLVELKKTNGDTMEYQKLVKEEIRPALKDIVWVWQGDQHQHSQPILQGEQQQSPLPPQQPLDQLPPQQPQDQLQPSLPRQEPQDMSEPPLPPQELQDQLQPPIPPDHLKS